MGKVECFKLAGIDLWFNSSDHEPPHFHARKPDRWEVRVFFAACTRTRLDFNLKFPPAGPGPSGQERRELLDLVLQHREALYAEWEVKVCRRS